jgi:hypothetical protein
MTDDLVEFVAANGSKSWKFSAVDHSSPVEFTRWVFEQDNMGWLKLDVGIDLAAWTEESRAAEPHYVDHRSSENYQGMKHKGWKSCCVHGIDIHRTEADETANRHLFHWTALSESVPVITDFWKNHFPVEGYRRLRFMKLEPGGFIGIHNDLPTNSPLTSLKDLRVLVNSVAVNVAITQPEGCDFVTENFGTVPWSEGDVYIINVTQNHCVVNLSDKPRIHMIAECVVGDRISDFSEMIHRSFVKNHVNN